MKYKLLQLLLIVLLPGTLMVQAQKPGYPRPDLNAEIPFGKKQPPPATYGVDERNPNLKEMLNIASWKKELGIPEYDFDTVNKRIRLFRPERAFHEMPAVQMDQQLNKQAGKDKPFIKNFELTKDINQISNSYPANSSPYGPSSSFAIMNGVSYFSAEDGIHGRELWRSDGTARGTYLFKDLNPGEAASNPTDITAVNGKLFFTAYSAAHGEELWVSDGTSAGTKMLADVVPGPEASHPSQMVGVGNSVFFITSPGPAYYYVNSQVWKTDGTPAGTLLLLDLTGSQNSSFIYQPTKINNLLFFVVRTYNYLYGPAVELWRSDGTKQGTFAVKNFGGDFWGLMHLTAYNNKLYLSADDGTGRKLWMSDGTAPGTIPAPFDNGIRLTAYYNSSSRTPFQQIGNSLLIFGAPASGGSGLYKYDASSTTGMQLVKNLTSSTEHPPSYQSEIVSLGGFVYFKLTKPTGYMQHDELWRTDGTTGNTTAVKEFSSGINLYGFFSHNDRIYFSTYSYYNTEIGQEPWVSDGTSEGTMLLKDIFKGPESSSAAYFTSINGKLIFTARDENGFELWTTNGTEAGTSILKDINTHSTESSNAGTSGNLASFGKNVLFPANDEAHGQELYISDGSSKGTFLLADINPRPRQSSYQGLFLSKNNYVYFHSTWYDTSRTVSAIYKSDGSTSGTTQVIDLGLIDNERTSIRTYNVGNDGIVYYAPYHSRSGTYSIWRTDGTTAGTYMLADNFYYSSDISIVGNYAYFVAGNAQSGYELWKTDGSKEGTKMIKDIHPGSDGSYPYSLFPFKGELYFGAYDGQTYYSFWKTDGTENGTIKLKSIAPTSSSYWSDYPVFAVSNDVLYFSAYDYNAITYQGTELWKTDGTSEGTALVKDINPNNNASPLNLIDVDGTLYFLADDGVHGYELWTTNGSESGTSMLTDFAGYRNFYRLTGAAGRLFFLINGASGGTELWTSDGSINNTKPVQGDVLDNISSISNIKGVDDRLFVSGYAYKYGTELFSAKIKEPSPAFSAIDLKAIPEIPGNESLNIQLFPNPAKHLSTLKVSGYTGVVSVRITDITGKMIWERSYNNLMQINLPMEKLHAGLYTVTVKNGREVKTIKLIKQ